MKKRMPKKTPQKIDFGTSLGTKNRPKIDENSIKKLMQKKREEKVAFINLS